MGGAFPELKKNPQRVMDLIRDEEVSFGKTLDRGIKLFEDAAIYATVTASIKKKWGQHVNIKGITIHSDIPEETRVAKRLPLYSVDLEREPGVYEDLAIDEDIVLLQKSLQQSASISAEAAFKLHDTYGFPIDLTRIMAEERGMTVDLAGYEKLMEQARELARAGGKQAESSVADFPPDATSPNCRGEKITPTNDQPKLAQGYRCRQKIEAIWTGEKFVRTIGGGRWPRYILNHTNFYSGNAGRPSWRCW